MNEVEHYEGSFDPLMDKACGVLGKSNAFTFSMPFDGWDNRDLVGDVVSKATRSAIEERCGPPIILDMHFRPGEDLEVTIHRADRREVD